MPLLITTDKGIPKLVAPIPYAYGIGNSRYYGGTLARTSVRIQRSRVYNHQRHEVIFGKVLSRVLGANEIFFPFSGNMHGKKPDEEGNTFAEILCWFQNRAQNPGLNSTPS